MVISDYVPEWSLITIDSTLSGINVVTSLICKSNRTKNPEDKNEASNATVPCKGDLSTLDVDLILK